MRFRLRILAGLLGTVLASNGWTPSVAAANGPICSEPPKSATTTGGCRWSQLSYILGVNPSWQDALEFIDHARALGLERASAKVLEAAARKSSRADVTVAREELARSIGEPVNLSLAKVARDPAVRAHLVLVSAIRELERGQIAGFWAQLQGVQNVGAGLAWRDLPFRTRAMADRLLGLGSPSIARSSSYVKWREAIRSGSRLVQSHHSMSLGALAESAPVRQAWTRAALREWLRRRGARLVLLSVAQARFDPTKATAGSAVENCHAVLPSPGAVRIECGIMTLAAHWNRGAFDAASEAFRRLKQVSWPAGGLLHARAATAVLPFLRLAGAEAEHRSFWQSAVEEADALGDVDLEEWLVVERASVLRLHGEYDRAEELLARIPAPNRGSSAALERARLAAAQRQPLRLYESLRASRPPSSSTAAERAAYMLTALELAPDLLEATEWLWLQREFTPPGISSEIWQSILESKRLEARMIEPAGEAGYSAVRLVARALPAGAESGLRSQLMRPWAENGARLLLAHERSWDALSLLEAEPRSNEGLSLAHVQAHLQPSDLMVAIRSVSGEVVVWTIDRSGSEAHRTGMSSAGWRRQLEFLSELLSSRRPNPGWEDLVAGAGRKVLGTTAVAEAIARARRVYVVIDVEFAAVPMDLLIAGAAGRGLTAVPVVLHATSLEAYEKAWHVTTSGLGAAAFLPARTAKTMDEAAVVSASLDAKVYFGVDATVTAFTQFAPRYEFLHFGGHSRSPTSIFDRGGLVLRGGQQAGPMELGSEAIAELPLHGQVVVLLACDTVGNRYSRSGSGGTVAEAFMLAGSRAVIGNMWSIRDDEAARLAAVFYAEGGPVGGAVALQRTKAKMQELNPSNTAAWAGLVWFGADIAPARTPPPGSRSD